METVRLGSSLPKDFLRFAFQGFSSEPKCSSLTLHIFKAASQKIFDPVSGHRLGQVHILQELDPDEVVLEE